MMPTGLASSAAIEFSLAPLTKDHGIPLAVMGILVVFFALTLVAVFITILPRLLSDTESHSEADAATIATARDEQLAEETVVVIAAAVAAVMTQPHRIVRIRGLSHGESVWSMEGRMQQHQSHRFQPRANR